MGSTCKGMPRLMKTAIIGCGYVADFYANNVKGHEGFEISKAFDIDQARLQQFCKYFEIASAASIEEVLNDSSIEMVLNLTNPRSHFDVTKKCLEAGKHVYSEKPIAMTVAQSQELIQIANQHKVRLGCAPCSVLGDTAQTVWKAIEDGMIGKVRLVYANYDDGMIAPNMSPWTWTTESGAKWPAKDEFEVGCTFEHAGYFLTWLAAYFGPARRVTAFSSTQIPDKGIAVDSMAPDFSVGCLEYDDGVVARVTSGLVAPQDKSLTVVGDEGALTVPYLRNDQEKVFLTRDRKPKNLARVENWMNRIQRRLSFVSRKLPWPIQEWSFQEQVPFARTKSFRPAAAAGKHVDFWRGPVDLANAIKEDRPHRMSAELAVHVVELINELQHPTKNGYEVETSFPKIEPLEWDA